MEIRDYSVVVLKSNGHFSVIDCAAPRLPANYTELIDCTFFDGVACLGGSQGLYMLVDDNGIANRKELNLIASRFYPGFPISFIFGDVLFCYCGYNDLFPLDQVDTALLVKHLQKLGGVLDD